jgi:hypothetical protein
MLFEKHEELMNMRREKQGLFAKGDLRPGD